MFTVDLRLFYVLTHCQIRPLPPEGIQHSTVEGVPDVPVQGVPAQGIPVEGPSFYINYQVFFMIQF